MRSAWLTAAATTSFAAILLVALLAWQLGSGSHSAAVTTSDGAAQRSSTKTKAEPTVRSLPGLQTGTAPWIAEQEQLRARLEALNIPFSNMEGTALHIHSRLRVSVSGRAVTVPADIGISYTEQAMAALHTHDTEGTIHVESPVVRDYTLGEFFDVWGVLLTKRCIGSHCAGNGDQLRVFVDGDPATGNPRSVDLAEGQDIVVAFGTPAQTRRPIP